MSDKLPSSREPSLPADDSPADFTQKRGDAAWDAAPPPTPDETWNPALYEGLLPRRILAYLVDATLVSVIAALLWFVLVVMTFGLLAGLLPVIALLPILYHGYFIGRSGATPGMRFMSLEVRTLAGPAPNFLQAFLLAAIFFFTIVPTLWLVLLVALFNERRRTLHDWLVGTLVVRSEAVRSEAVWPGRQEKENNTT